MRQLLFPCACGNFHSSSLFTGLSLVLLSFDGYCGSVRSYNQHFAVIIVTLSRHETQNSFWEQFLRVQDCSCRSGDWGGKHDCVHCPPHEPQASPNLQQGDNIRVRTWHMTHDILWVRSPLSAPWRCCTWCPWCASPISTAPSTPSSGDQCWLRNNGAL